MVNQSGKLPCGRSKEFSKEVYGRSAHLESDFGKSDAPKPEVGKKEVWKKRLKEYLSANGLKFTVQRWKIVELILSSSGHLDAQGLVELVRKRHSGIGAATVYRSIKVLCDAGILKESLTGSEGQIFYEFSDGAHHDHIVCLDCGEIFEFYDQKMESLQSAAVEKQDFKEVHHRHVIYAHCKYKKTR